MSSSEDGSEFQIREEESESDDDGPSWILGAAAETGAVPDCGQATPDCNTSQPAKRKAESMDTFFGALMSEVNGLKSAKKKKLEKQFASPEELIERLMSKDTMSAFEVLMIAPDATDGEITKMYRKVSFMVHPDKCKHEHAHEAFQKVAKAYEELKDPTYKEKYQDVIEKAKALVTAAREKENEAREKSGKEMLVMHGTEFDQAIVAECERMLNVTVEQATYADEVRAKNTARIESLQKERKQREKTVMTDKKKWEVNRDKRVAGWQIFRNNVEQKKFKNKSSGSIGVLGAADRFHKREERTELEEEQKKKAKNKNDPQGRPAGVDFSFKTTWR